MREALEWIKESLQDVVDDHDEESSEGIPLVPLTDYSSAAMDSPSFQKLLRAMGFVPPADAQESFWRIPANMLTTMLQKRCKLIGDALAGEFVVEETRKDHSDTDERVDDSEDDTNVFENVKKFFAPREPGPSTFGQSELSTKIQSSQKSKILLSLNEESDEAESIEKTDKTEVVVKAHKESISNVRSRVRMLDDSSESEMEIERDIDDKNDDVKRDRSDFSSDTDKPSTKKRRLFDSDEETETLRSDYTEANSASAIISDDEESLPNVRSERPTSRVIISDEED